MTLTAEQSSNKARFEAAPTAEIIDIIRTAMDEGCIRPCHVYDAVDELICRIQVLDNRPNRNCDLFTNVEDARNAHHKICEEYGACNKACGYQRGDHGTCICFQTWLFLPVTKKQGGMN